MTGFPLARLLALLVPAALLGGALLSQYGFGLFPCEMCHWQRWPHEAAIGFAILAFLFRNGAAARLFVMLAGIAILVSGAIGVFHAGVEYGWWQGLTTCSTAPAGGNAAEVLQNIMNTPLVRCDQAQWTLAGISLAGFNALFSFAGGLAVLWLLARSKRRPS